MQRVEGKPLRLEKGFVDSVSGPIDIGTTNPIERKIEDRGGREAWGFFPADLSIEEKHFEPGGEPFGQLRVENLRLVALFFQ